MKIHVSSLKPLAIQWIDAEVMPKSSPLQKFLLTFAILQMDNQIDQYIQKAVLFADKEGYIDLDKAKENTSIALEKAGGIINIPFLDWNFDKEDLDKVFALAEKQFAK